MSTVLSREFTKAGVKRMVPFADLMNFPEDEARKACVRCTTTSEAFTCVTVCELSPGDEVTFYYGDFTPESMLSRYGFASELNVRTDRGRGGEERREEGREEEKRRAREMKKGRRFLRRAEEAGIEHSLSLTTHLPATEAPRGVIAARAIPAGRPVARVPLPAALTVRSFDVKFSGNPQLELLRGRIEESGDG